MRQQPRPGIIMNNDKTALINIIAPALRMILAKKGIAPVVILEEGSTCSCGCGQLEISSPDEDKIIKILNTIDKSTSAVSVKDIGTFKIVHNAPRNGRTAGMTAIITGAAQGFGFEIAQELAAQGANVVLADINEQGVSKASEQINKAAGANVATGLAVDVTNGESVANMIHQAVRRFGGIDIFISNAGVLKAGSVKEQPEKDFDFSTNVNYKGYFLCCKYAAKILAVQHKANPSYMSDIIQINSKSGLEGSNKNGAYAGSKFGGIGLTQSFALELIEDGIKVNSICPGNFFDGPLWSDPEKGLFVQYLRTGKVPGAKTIGDVKKFYEAKVPMKRGCSTTDVMKAIYYIVEQKYETGQAVPVTGGQVMLN